MIARRAKNYFAHGVDVPPPLTATVSRRIQFHETDLMGIVWHGHYAALFEEASTEVRRQFGMGYEDLRLAGLRAPIVQMHVDFYRPLWLDEIARITARLIWNEAARLDFEYEICGEDGRRSVSGYTVQMFVDAITREPFLCSPELLRRCRERWRAETIGARA